MKTLQLHISGNARNKPPSEILKWVHIYVMYVCNLKSKTIFYIYGFDIMYMHIYKISHS